MTGKDLYPPGTPDRKDGFVPKDPATPRPQPAPMPPNPPKKDEILKPTGTPTHDDGLRKK